MINLQDKESEIIRIRDEIIHSVNIRVEERLKSISLQEKNIRLNEFEFKQRTVVLNSTPEGLGLGAHYHCNAKCTFCLGGKPKIFSLQRFKEFFEPRLCVAISQARYFNFCGFGELLLMPKIEEFLDYVNERMPQINKIYTTNGAPLLNNSILPCLSQGKNVVEISLHASHRRLHKILTRMNLFDDITAKIKELVMMRQKQGSPTISLIFLVNTLNVEDLSSFIELAAGLGVDEVLCSYMIVFKKAQLKFSCFFKQEITNDSFKKAQDLAQKLNIRVKLPPFFGEPAQFNGNGSCSDMWKYFYVENEGTVVPCCYAGGYFGYLDRDEFGSIWNGAYYQEYRRSLAQHNPPDWCRYCMRHKADNVNDIRAHISFRPGIWETVLDK